MTDVRISDLTSAPTAAVVDATLVEISTGAGGASYGMSIGQLKTWFGNVFQTATQVAAALDSYAALAGATFTGAVKGVAPAIDDSSAAFSTTSWFMGQLASSTPAANGAAAIGTSTRAARADHVHATDTTRAKAGANSDITSLSGLTTPLSAAQGGTGRTDGGASPSDLNVAQQNILYQGLLIAALRNVPTGLVDGILDPFSSLADINTGASSGYSFNSATGTIGATPDQTKSLLHFDGANGSTTFTDAASAGRTFTKTGSPVVSTAQSVFGGASLRLPGSAYLTAPASADFGIGTGDFTIEFRFRPDAIGTEYDLVDTRASSGSAGITVAILSSGKAYVFDGTAGAGAITGATTLSAATWYSLAVTRTGGTMRLFVNGNVDGSQSNTSNFGSSNPLTVGANIAAGNSAVGYMDEFRFTNGLARYTAAYTPAAAAFAIAASAMTLQSATLASAVASPSAMRALIQVDSTSAALTPNTDMLAYLCRDGATFTQGSLALVQTMPDGTVIYDTGWLSVTGQPTGNSTMTYKITTPTQLAIVLTGVSMQVKP